MAEFREFPKIPRLNRDITITEKLDGTNAAVIIEEELVDPGSITLNVGTGEFVPGATTGRLLVTAQSRNRLITPGKTTDNYGFAQWVQDNAEGLKLLGPGHHYGEWYGKGIARGYNLAEKHFALFDIDRWTKEGQLSQFFAAQEAVPQLELVPLLHRGPWTGVGGFDMTDVCIMELKNKGSVAVPGFMQPEGIIVYHHAARQRFKVTVEKDAEWKGPHKQEEHE